MKLLSLFMEAFGPYADPITIDFTSLENHALFLITGPTGAGKTTIFDAVAYALYGKASGDYRHPENFRSDYAEETRICNVELTFFCRGQAYAISRSPSQFYRGKSGRLVKYDARVQLTLPGGGVLTKAGEVDRKVKEVLGLDFTQFRQIVMLPQGEFKRFLDSGSDKKQEIFRRLFSTDLYMEVENRLKQEEANLGQDLEQLSYRRANHLALVAANLPALQEALAAEYVEMERVLVLLEEQLGQDQEERRHLMERRDETGKAYHSIDLEQLARQNERLDSYQTLLEEQKQLESGRGNYLAQTERLQKGRRAVAVHVAQEEIKGLEKDIASGEAMLVTVAKDLDKYTQAEAEAKKGLEQADGWDKEREALTRSLGEVTSLLADLDEAARIEAALEKSKAGLSKNRSRLTTFELLLRRCALYREQKESEEKMKALGQLNEGLKGYIALLGQHSQAQLTYAQAYDLYIKGQAGLLAQALEEGQPCPVCGSNHHPKKAALAHNIPRQEEIRRLKEDGDRLSAQVNSGRAYLETQVRAYVEGDKPLEQMSGDLEQALASQKHSLDLRRKAYRQAHENCARCFKDPVLLEDDRYLDGEWLGEAARRIETEMVQLEAESQSFLRQLETLSKKFPQGLDKQQTLARQQGMQNRVNLLREQIDRAEKDFRQAANQVHRMLGEQHRLEEELQRRREQLQARTQDFHGLLVRQGFESLDAWRECLIEDEVLTQLEKTVRAYEDSLGNNQARLAVLEKEVAGRERVDLDALGAEKEALAKALAELEARLAEVSARIQVNQEQYGGLRTLEEQFRQKEARYNHVAFLTKVATGRYGSHISFERYVLASYFEDVVRAANLRLSKMTEGRFTLGRRGDKEKRGRASGLELDVLDSYTGKTRHTNTLSGGESFQASLALALGLSDVIQRWAGGVQIDTMFIDEGFGSLDQDSIEGAIATLSALGGKGRVVGIISHVQELRNQIPARLEVIPGFGGSRAAFQI